MVNMVSVMTMDDTRPSAHAVASTSKTPLGCEEQISLRGADVEVASDYTKRRNVMRLSTHGGSQLLLQADTQADMCAWLNTIHHNIAQHGWYQRFNK